MRDVLHDWWPVAAVALFTLFLVVQIPRKAIFPPKPAENEVTPFASFVTLDDDAYAVAVQRGRMSWQLRPRMTSGGVEGGDAAFDFDEPLPPPRALPVGTSFTVPCHMPRPAPPAPASLLPVSLARSGVDGLAEAVEAAARPRDEDLLVLPDSLKEK